MKTASEAARRAAVYALSDVADAFGLFTTFAAIVARGLLKRLIRQFSASSPATQSSGDSRARKGASKASSATKLS
jgi:hypothetical protein